MWQERHCSRMSVTERRRGSPILKSSKPQSSVSANRSGSFSITPITLRAPSMVALFSIRSSRRSKTRTAPLSRGLLSLRASRASSESSRAECRFVRTTARAAAGELAVDHDGRN